MFLKSLHRRVCLESGSDFALALNTSVSWLKENVIDEKLLRIVPFNHHSIKTHNTVLNGFSTIAWNTQDLFLFYFLHLWERPLCHAGFQAHKANCSHPLRWQTTYKTEICSKVPATATAMHCIAYYIMQKKINSALYIFLLCQHSHCKTSRYSGRGSLVR